MAFEQRPTSSSSSKGHNKYKRKGERKERKDPNSQVELRILRGVTSPKGLSSSAEIGEY
jgi:hypothetical protein